MSSPAANGLLPCQESSTPQFSQHMPTKATFTSQATEQFEFKNSKYGSYAIRKTGPNKVEIHLGIPRPPGNNENQDVVIISPINFDFGFGGNVAQSANKRINKGNHRINHRSNQNENSEIGQHSNILRQQSERQLNANVSVDTSSVGTSQSNQVASSIKSELPCKKKFILTDAIKSSRTDGKILDHVTVGSQNKQATQVNETNYITSPVQKDTCLPISCNSVKGTEISSEGLAEGPKRNDTFSNHDDDISENILIDPIYIEDNRNALQLDQNVNAANKDTSLAIIESKNVSKLVTSSRDHHNANDITLSNQTNNNQDMTNDSLTLLSTEPSKNSEKAKSNVVLCKDGIKRVKCYDKDGLNFCTIQSNEAACSLLFFDDEESYQKHLKTDHRHDSKQPYSCYSHKCSASFQTRELLNKHYNSNHSTQLRCNCCTFTAKSLTKFKSHVLSCHSKGLFYCSKQGCTFTGTTRRDVINHYRNSLYRCQVPTCRIIFRKSSDLIMHQCEEHGRKFHCRWQGCYNLEFNSFFEAYNHIEATHLNLASSSVEEINSYDKEEDLCYDKNLYTRADLFEDMISPICSFKYPDENVAQLLHEDSYDHYDGYYSDTTVLSDFELQDEIETVTKQIKRKKHAKKSNKERESKKSLCAVDVDNDEDTIIDPEESQLVDASSQAQAATETTNESLHDGEFIYCSWAGCSFYSHHESTVRAHINLHINDFRKNSTENYPDHFISTEMFLIVKSSLKCKS